MSPYPAKQYEPKNDEFADALCASPTLEPLRELTDWFDQHNYRDDEALIALTRLFDSTDPYDHGEARKICDACPMKANGKCLLRLGAVHEAAVSSERDGGPEGTWSGLRVGGKKKPGRKPIAECGTDAGYHRHRRVVGDEPCQPCKTAHTRASWTKKEDVA